MDSQILQLASTIISKSDSVLKTHLRFLVAIAGRPGSGKSTVADRLAKSINQISFDRRRRERLDVDDHDQQRPVAVVVGLDGWHYARSVLDQFEDPAEAHRRRGAPDTFDGPGYLCFVESLLARRGPVRAPVFSHAAKDPVPDGLVIGADERIVILEGLYTLLTDGPAWTQATRLVHLALLVDASPEAAQRRLVERHVRTGICADTHQAALRVEFNDLPNGDYLLNHIRTPDIIIKSIEDESLTAQEQP